jgi:hypothetical protein
VKRRPPPSNRADRLRREPRTRNRRKPDLGALARALCLVALGSQCLRVAFASPRLQLKEVQVEGTARLSPEDVQRMAGIRLGGNIFGVNLVRVRQALLQDPTIREAVVTRELPDRVAVQITDRVPEYQVAAQGVRYDVDAEDVVFQRARRYLLGRPLLDIPPAHLPPLGRKLRPEYAATARECVVLARNERLDLRHMRVDSSGELWLGIATAAGSGAASPDSQPGEETEGAEGSRQEPGPQAEGQATPGAAPGKLKVRVGRMTDLPAKFRDIRNSLRGLPGLTLTAAHLDVMCPGRPAYLKLEPEKTP